jgi:glucuronate isomerase
MIPPSLHRATAAEAEAFRGQMLTEMAKMSLEDGLVMQIHPGSFRNHNPQVHQRFGRFGFNDDTRAFLSIPARHDVARRMDCRFLAQLVAEHKIEEDEAFELAPELAYGLAKRAYKL